MTDFKMAAPRPQVALRGKEGLWMVHGPPDFRENAQFPRDSSVACRVMAYSPDGTLFAWCNGQSTTVIRVADWVVVQQIPTNRTAQLGFSPRGTYLATWQQYHAIKDNPAASYNLHIWNLETGKSVKATIQKKRALWRPQWTSEESVCAVFASGGVHFYRDHDFENITARLTLPRMEGCVLSEGEAPPTVGAYVPVIKGTPAFVRLYRYPNLGGEGSALASRSFFKADSIHMLWNKKGTALLAMASTDEDKTGQSYYGEQSLHFLETNGEGCAVTLPKKGPIYSIDWNPNSMDFCVVYGFSPAKATLFNLKCEPIYDFGTGPRNCVYYNPQGTVLCLAGFGNLRGKMEFWGRGSLKLVSRMQADDSTQFEWSPDGEHFLTATCAPRLRVGNGYKFWHYSGRLLNEFSVPRDKELWEAVWQPFPAGTFPAKPIISPQVAATQAEPKPAPYRPPNATGASTVKFREEEAPEAVSDKALSKNALKNKKKREAKAKAKKEELVGSPLDPRSAEQRDALAMASYVLGPAQNTPVTPPSLQDATIPTEIDKKIKNLRKKLKAIEKLKEQKAEGKTLEANQLSKIEGEAVIIQELQELELNG
ncbi:eukaryotic translation initiation factor 2A-like [Acanthaster planci]|uniref:Eukaryotic translation initiation factor 2A n=1 Tax=Acanthaster planci TaxID=133434 RepID=A0A8B7YN33_ACAPL|nr:eukaryotic translation initiation factor 2A-like [Acanthaster planci]